MKFWKWSFWKEPAWALIGAIIGTALSVPLTLWWHDPRGEVTASIERELNDDRALAVEEINLLTQIILSCNPSAAGTLTVSAGGNGEPDLDIDPAARFLGDYKLSEDSDVAEIRNQALVALGERNYKEARDAVESAQAEYRNTPCYRDLDWERTVRHMTLCQAEEQYGDPQGPLRGWKYVRSKSDAAACDTGSPSVDGLLLCDAIVNENDDPKTSGDFQTSRRIQQACGLIE